VLKLDLTYKSGSTLNLILSILSNSFNIMLLLRALRACPAMLVHASAGLPKSGRKNKPIMTIMCARVPQVWVLLLLFPCGAFQLPTRRQSSAFQLRTLRRTELLATKSSVDQAQEVVDISNLINARDLASAFPSEFGLRPGCIFRTASPTTPLTVTPTTTHSATPATTAPAAASTAAALSLQTNTEDLEAGSCYPKANDRGFRTLIDLRSLKELNDDRAIQALTTTAVVMMSKERRDQGGGGGEAGGLDHSQQEQQ
jgi:hypothetical protein